MCGIAGVFALAPGAEGPDRALLARMCGALRHRGPDEFGIYRDQRAGLAHARLSIIDLAAGQQPLCNEDDSLWLVFNGEIFNYLELREELLAAGHRFRTRSDTEVIVHAYEQWGAEAFARFNGQWAVALYDRRKQELVLSRDRHGVRPLYYVEQGGRLYFASEVKALFAAPEVPRALDHVGLGEVFTFWAPLAPRTVFQHVRELEPGHSRVYRADGVIEDRAYWSPSYEPTSRFADVGEAAEAVREALERAVSLRMLRADVPVGSYLSGGLDSSLVAALGMAALGRRFHTFSVRFQDAEFDETTYQRQVVARLGTEHHEIVVSRADIANVFPDVIRHAERPILRTAPAPMFLLSRLVRDAGIKVVLTGEGADEMFGGYDLFREGKVRRFWARRPDSKLRPRLLERLYPYLARSPVRQQAMARQFFGQGLAQAGQPGFSHALRWSSTSALLRLFDGDAKTAASRPLVAELLDSLPASLRDWSGLAQDQYLECRTLLSGYLLSAQGDRMLMANSVEGRFPFLDREVVALANELPDDYKLHVLDEKHVLKRIGRALLPPEVVNRPKQPYRAPDAASFFAADAPAWIRDLTTERALKAAGVFAPRAVGALFDKARARADGASFSNTDNMGVVGVLSTQLLYDSFIATPPAPDPVTDIQTVVER